MLTERKKIVSEQNYEISRKIYNLFKKYKNYESEIKKAQIVEKYNPDELFKNKREIQRQEVAIMEVKEQKWYSKIFDFIKKIFKK